MSANNRDDFNELLNHASPSEMDIDNSMMRKSARSNTVSFSFHLQVKEITNEWMPMIFESYKSERKGDHLITEGSERDNCWCCSNSNILNSQFRTIDGSTKGKVCHEFAVNPCESYLSNEKNKVFQLERQITQLMQENL